jgi:hypothetical protein
MSKGSTRPGKPDLFSTTSVQEPSSLSANRVKAAPWADKKTPVPSLLRYVLPKDLPGAIKQLNDDELERLIAVALAEQKRRGGKPLAVSSKRPAERVGVTLTPSKINAVRAAFKAGFKPTQIARQFRISRADVRKALASE